MTPKLLLRIASLLIFFHGVGHTIGFSSWKQATDPVKQEVINQMVGHQFEFMGAMRSMGDYYTGYGWFAAVALLVIAGILWIVSSQAVLSPRFSRNILILLFLSLIIIGVDELLFFFVFAASFSLLAALLTGIVVFQLANSKTA